MESSSEHQSSELGQLEPQNNVQKDNDANMFIETFFDEGPLGVTLRRRVEDGIVFIFEVIPNSQAVNIDVQLGDELWAVDDNDIGGAPLDKEAWVGLVNYIKQSPRPIRMIWKRTKQTQLNVQSPPPAAVVSSAGSTKSAQLRPDSPPQTTPEQHSPEYIELQKVLVRLVIKDKENSSTAGGVGSVLGFGGTSSTSKRSSASLMPEPASLLKEGRRIVKIGDLGRLDTSKTNSLWGKTTNKRRLILLNDLLLITIPQTGNVFALEHSIDLQTCKVKSLGYIFSLQDNNRRPTDDNEKGEQPEQPNEEDVSFQLIWPGGNLEFCADSSDGKNAWVMSIYITICDVMEGSVQYLGWRHHFLLGTMHSAVLTRNEERVRELIHLCNDGKLDFKVIETFDDDGYTPLHYACMLRLQNIVRLLHEATADVTAADKDGLTPLHWAAMQLDDYSLDLLCSHVFDLDVLDKKNRTPLVVACLEGRDLSGLTDCSALQKCLEIMASHKPNFHWVDDYNRSLVHYLAASWQFEPLEVILENGALDVNTIETEFGMTPLHFVARANPIKAAVGEGMKILSLGKSGNGNNSQPPDSGLHLPPPPEPIHHPFGVDTMRLLFQYGAKPNMKDYYGRTPLQIMLQGESELLWDQDDLEAAVAVFLSYGARPDDNILAHIKNKFPDLNVSALTEKWTSLPVIDCKKIDVKLNQFEPLPDVNNPESLQQVTPVSPTTSGNSRGNKENNTNNPEEKGVKPTCSMCGFQFTMFKRQHHCRLCNCICCDDCSKRRTVMGDNNQLRTCDGCFNRVLSIQDKLNAKAILASIKPLSSVQQQSGLSSDNEQRSELFKGSNYSQQQQHTNGGNSNNGNNRSTDGNLPVRTQSKLGGTMATMNETHERLLERGEKLSQLQDRTGDLANQANEFARLAKQLNEQQKSRWF